jgi:ABC-type polysaccharide/polyol phosphate export permease
MNVQTSIMTAPAGTGAVLSMRGPRIAPALADLVDGLRRWELWGTLAWFDIRQRYRRSTLGPFWITISMGVMVIGLSVLWSTLFRQDLSVYMPFFAVGFIVWTLISSMIQEGCTAFYGSEGIIKQLPAPLSIHVYRLVWRNLIITAHNLCIYVGVALVFQIWPGFGLVSAAIGFLLLAINGASVGIICGILSARFRDIPPIVASLLQMIFFFSPILWLPESLPGRHYLVEFNPFYYLIEIVRMPLLGKPLDGSIWGAVIGITVLTCAVAFGLFARFRQRLAYWV